MIPNFAHLPRVEVGMEGRILRARLANTKSHLHELNLLLGAHGLQGDVSSHSRAEVFLLAAHAPSEDARVVTFVHFPSRIRKVVHLLHEEISVNTGVIVATVDSLQQESTGVRQQHIQVDIEPLPELRIVHDL